MSESVPKMTKNEKSPSENDDRLLRVVFFAALMLLVIEMNPIISGVFYGTDLYELVVTGLFFLTFGLIYFIVLGFIRWEGGSSISELGIDLEDDEFFPHLAIGAIAGSVAAILVVVIAFLFGGTLRPTSAITPDLIAGEIIITVPTALFEELAYRGYLTTRLVDIIGKGRGIIISSLFFGLLHFGWWTPLGTVPIHLILLFTLNLTLGGIVLSYAYYWSGNKLWVPIAFHFMWNMIAYLLFPTFPRDPVLMPEIYQIEWGVTTIAGFLFGLSIIWILLNPTKRKK
ncbi:MAG: lysostaphin resistance A-like protein [Candidatus Thorarchaeota archaeon]